MSIEAEPTGLDLVNHLSRGHSVAGICPKCGETCLTTGLPSLAYTFEVCSCGEPEFDHLVEQLWHARCLIEWKPESDGPAWTALVEIAEAMPFSRAPNLRYRARRALDDRVYGNVENIL